MKNLPAIPAALLLLAGCTGEAANGVRTDDSVGPAASARALEEEDGHTGVAQSGYQLFEKERIRQNQLKSEANSRAQAIAEKRWIENVTAGPAADGVKRAGGAGISDHGGKTGSRPAGVPKAGE